MLVHRLKMNATITVAGTKITNIGGGPCVIGIEGPDKVNYPKKPKVPSVPVDKHPWDVVS